MISTARLIGVATAALLLSLPSSAVAVDYVEGVDGDLSGDTNNPTVFGPLNVGANSLTATSGGGDLDLLTFSIAGGQQLASIVLDSYAGSGVSFAGLQNSATWTEGTGAAIDPSNLLGWAHYGGGEVGTDFLDDIGSGAGAVGFLGPLPAGDYTLLLQDTGGAVSYGMTFNIVPEPSGLLLATLACGLLAAGAWRRSARASRRR